MYGIRIIVHVDFSHIDHTVECEKLIFLNYVIISCMYYIALCGNEF